MEDRKQPFLLYKKDIPALLNYNSMSMVYKKILTEQILKELGFKSAQEFKNIKIFTLEQSRILRTFFNSLTGELGDQKEPTTKE